MKRFFTTATQKKKKEDKEIGEQKCLKLICDVSFSYFEQALGKREPEQESEAQAWIETITGESFPEGDKNIAYVYN